MTDDQGDTFTSGETRPGADSFIVTGHTHPLNPFINNFNCNETIVWSYFDIKEVGGRLRSNNVGRNSLIDCRSPSEEVHCNVYYRALQLREFGSCHDYDLNNFQSPPPLSS